MVVVGCVLLGSRLVWAAAPPLAKFEPEYGCYLGAFVFRDSNIGGDMRLFEQLTGKPHASYLNYVGYGQPFPREWVEEVKAVGAVPHIAFEPNDGLQAVQDDPYLRAWARAAREAGCPIFLRFASEMNGTWQKYSGNPALYIQKWRLVHRVMAEVAPNVAMVWNPYCTPRRPIPWYYPGDEYVDWVGVNLYSVHHHDNDIRQPSDHEDPRDLLQFVYDLYSGRKPIMVGEYAATHYCLACRQPTVGFALEKMRLLYESLPGRFPRVKMVTWFNWDTLREGAAANNYALTDDDRILQQYRQLIGNPYFLSRLPYERALPQEVRIAAAPGEGELASNLPSPALENGGRSSSQRPAPVARPRRLLEVQSPLAGAEVSGSIRVQARAAAEVEAEYVLFKVDGEVVHITNSAPWVYLWNTARFPAGERTLQVVAVRRDGSEEESPPVKVTVRHE